MKKEKQERENETGGYMEFNRVAKWMSMSLRKGKERENKRKRKDNEKKIWRG